jgi:hypothetical protein
MVEFGGGKERVLIGNAFRYPLGQDGMVLGSSFMAIFGKCFYFIFHSWESDVDDTIMRSVEK